MSFKESLSELRDIDFADLDIQQIGVWPAALKIILVVSIVLVIVGLGYF
jgi:type IV pilus assembly protein PilO